MSYPRLIQPLIIEDEKAVKRGYENIFKTFAATYNIAEGDCAFSYAQAVDLLKRDRIYHLVVLDLRLPTVLGVPPSEGLELGEALLQQCAERDEFPIPTLLVISASLHKADQEKLRASASRNFAYGRVLVKSPTIAAEIEEAVRSTFAYLDLGIHLRDGAEKRFPTISPREDDLLRRVLLTRPNATGVDFQWWSADTWMTPPASSPGWTKVLLGRILLEGDSSRPNFFKFLPSADGLLAISATERLAQKLSHVKLNGTASGGSRSLIVTEKVGDFDGMPTPLPDFLAGEGVTSSQVRNVARQIVDQLSRLGDRRPQSRQLRDLAWGFHDERNLRDLLTRYMIDSRPPLLCNDPNAVDIFYSKMVDESEVDYEEQTFLHGDLHLGNVVLDVVDNSPSAYIFDAGSTTAHVSSKDIASLEVCALLHQPLDDLSFTILCDQLYGSEALVPQGKSASDSAVANSTFHFVLELRTAVRDRVSRRLYSFMVLDFALVQLGGLAKVEARNKISSASHAALLVAYAAHWLALPGERGPVRETDSVADVHVSGEGMPS